MFPQHMDDQACRAMALDAAEPTKEPTPAEREVVRLREELARVKADYSKNMLDADERVQAMRDERNKAHVDAMVWRLRFEDLKAGAPGYDPTAQRYWIDEAVLQQVLDAFRDTTTMRRRRAVNALEAALDTARTNARQAAAEPARPNAKPEVRTIGINEVLNERGKAMLADYAQRVGQYERRVFEQQFLQQPAPMTATEEEAPRKPKRRRYFREWQEDDGA